MDAGTLAIYCGTGVPGYQDGNCTTARFDGPYGIAIVGNTMYVVDTGNVLIRAINMTSSNRRVCVLCVLVFAPV